MREKCGIGGINNMEKLIMNECRYCGKCFKHWVELFNHELKCDKLTEIEIKIKDEKLKMNIELLEAFREVQKQEFHKAIEEILKKP